GVSRFCPPSQNPRIGSVLCHPGKTQLPVQTHLFPECRQIDRGSMRPDRSAGKLLRKEGLPLKAPENQILRQRAQYTSGISYQQPYPARQDHCRPVSLSMARGTLLQMDQTASSDKGVLRHHRERGEDPGVDRHFCVRPCGHRKEALEAGSEPLHNSTDSERHFIRENAHFTGILSCGIRNKRGG